MKTAIHVLARRGPGAAAACFAHLRGQLPAEVRLRLLDDGTRDGTRELIARDFPAVETVSMPYDRGFAGAHNRALGRAFRAGEDAVLILSVDARPAPDFLAPLLEVMKMRPRAAFVSPKILLARDPQRLWYAGGQIDWWRGLAAQRGAGTLDDGRFDRAEQTDFATAAAMLVRNQAFDRAGPMDASYFNHLHDVDWSVRARRVGMEVHYQPESRVHYDGPAAGGADTWTRFEPLRSARSLEGEAEADGSAAIHRSRLRLVANHARWYHWPTAGPRVAADATSEAFRGWRRPGLRQNDETPAAALRPAGSSARPSRTSRRPSARPSGPDAG